MISGVSVFQTASQIYDRFSTWAHQHPTWVIWFGVTCIIGAMFFEDLRTRYPRLKIPPTPAQRLKEIEGQLKAHVGPHLGTKQTFFSLHEDVTMSAQHIRELETALNSVKGSVELLEHLRVSCKQFVLSLCAMEFLRAEARQAIVGLESLKAMYGDSSPAVRQPFSQWRSDWRPDCADESLRDGEKWALQLQGHITSAYFWFQGWYSQDMTLPESVDAWKMGRSLDLSADQVISMLKSHHSKLTELRDAQTASFAAGIFPSAAMS